MWPKRYNQEEYLFLNPIQITSPEQFVPLFLVNYLPHYLGSHHQLLANNNIYVGVPEADTHTLDREVMKKHLISQLNYPYPKSYSLPVPKDMFFQSNEIASLPSSAFPGAILGEDWEGYISQRMILHLGCWISYSQNGAMNNPVSKIFPFEEFLTIGSPIFSKSTMTPHLLFVVKAKLIPYLRARMYLDLPINVSVTDLKMLRNSNDASALPPDLTKYIKAIQPTVEYLTSQEILSYLIGPETGEPPISSKTVGIQKVQEMIKNPYMIKPVMEYA